MADGHPRNNGPNLPSSSMINGGMYGQSNMGGYRPNGGPMPPQMYNPGPPMPYHHQSNGLDSAMSNMSMYGGPPPPAMMSASGWNVNAAEFVPRAPQPQYGGPTMYNQAQVSPHHGGGGMMGGDQYGMGAYDSSWLADPAMDPSVIQPGVIFSDPVNQAMQGPAGPALMEIQVGLEQLVKMPDEADTWQEAIVQRMTYPKVMDLDLMKVVSTMIFETAATYTSSAYTIANLLGHMCRHPQLAESFLMRCVLPHIREEHEQRFTNLNNDVERLRAYAQLVAECFLRLTMRATTSRMEMIGTCVLEEADTLMSDLSVEDNVRCAALILKNCGKALDNDKPDKMDDVMDRIRAHVDNMDNALNVEARKQLKNVLVLHDNHWGQPQRGLPPADNKPAVATNGAPAAPTTNGSMDDDATRAYEQFLNQQTK